MKKPKSCPRCGDKHIYTVYWIHSWRKHIECRYCHFAGEPAFTKWGAIRKWNRAKNWRIIK